MRTKEANAKVKLAEERGIPFYIRTRQNNFYRCTGIAPDGTLRVETGSVTPEQVAKGPAGLSPEQRKEVGERLLERNDVIRKGARREAESILGSL